MTTEALVMSVFGLLVVAALVWGIIDGKRQRERTAAYIQKHGWRLVDPRDERILAALQQLGPELDWLPVKAIEVAGGSDAVYLLEYQVKTKGSRTQPSRRTGLLAARSGSNRGGPVNISTRLPGLDNLTGNPLALGTEAFRKEFTVESADEAAARAAVTPGLEEILLRHAREPQWFLEVNVAGKWVLAGSFWAQREQEWDYLVDLGLNLRGALK